MAEALTAVVAVSTEAAGARAEADPACRLLRVRAGDMLAGRGVLLPYLVRAPIDLAQDRAETVTALTLAREMETEVWRVLPRRLARRRVASGIRLAAGLAM